MSLTDWIDTIRSFRIMTSGRIRKRTIAYGIQEYVCNEASSLSPDSMTRSIQYSLTIEIATFVLYINNNRTWLVVSYFETELLYPSNTRH